MSSLEELKAKFLVIFLLVGTLLLSLMMIRIVLNPTQNFIMAFFSSCGILVLVVTTLFLLKFKGFSFAGNTISLGSIILLSISISIVSEEISVFFKYTQGFYSILGFLSFSFIFSSRRVLLINALLSAIAVTRVYLFGRNHEPELIQFITTGYFTEISMIFSITKGLRS